LCPATNRGFNLALRNSLGPLPGLSQGTLSEQLGDGRLAPDLAISMSLATTEPAPVFVLAGVSAIGGARDDGRRHAWCSTSAA
jgi:hypothetical protein